MKLINLWFFISGCLFPPGDPRIRSAEVWAGVCGITLPCCVVIEIVLTKIKILDWIENSIVGMTIPRFYIHLFVFIVLYVSLYAYYKHNDRGRKIIDRYNYMPIRKVCTLFLAYIISFIFLVLGIYYAIDIIMP